MKRMLKKNIRCSRIKRLIQLASGLVVLMNLPLSAYAQEMPPRPITVTVITTQNLSFGSFAQGTLGGTVTVSSSGMRTPGGNIMLLSGGSVSPALFDVVANPGTLITISNGPDVTLNGSNGGTLTLHIGSSSTGSPFITTVARPSPTHVYIGGTLTVGTPAASPPGDYSGSFQVTFVQQ
jgi:hypothetical protein